MDGLHSVLRALRGETTSRSHLKVFREFLGHLDRIGRRSRRRRTARAPVPEVRRRDRAR
jgi:hypothetical protein